LGISQVGFSPQPGIYLERCGNFNNLFWLLKCGLGSKKLTEALKFGNNSSDWIGPLATFLDKGHPIK